MTVNTFARDSEIERIPPYLEYLGDIGADGLIVSDPGVLALPGSTLRAHRST